MASIHNVLTRIYNFYQDGTTCKNPTLEAKTLEGMDIGCVKSDGTIVMTVDPTKEIHCIEIYVTCGDCPTCPKHRIVECFCGNGLLCPPCHTCDPIQNRCIPLCPGKPCINNTCVDCDPNNPCPPDKVCNNGMCECKPGTVSDGFGNCIKCKVNSDCPQCGLCQGFDCRPRQCTGGFLDPITCLCVECLEKTHCRPDQICDHGFCKCPPGTYLNSQTGLCTAIPKCTSGGPCPECFDCVIGECIPKVCPVGQICVRNECVSECNCSSRICPPGKSCVPIGNKCYCISCSNLPCGPGVPCPIGCMCGNGGSCLPNLCNGPCSPDHPCPPGCGCFMGKCQPCHTFNCSDCHKIPGCHCPNGICIGNDPCPPKPCLTGIECGPGCGCDSLTKTCKPCSGATCTTCIQIDGCICDTLTNNCVKNECDGDCVPGVPCKPGCACDPLTYKCKPCWYFSCSGAPCPKGCECAPGAKCRPDTVPPPPNPCEDTIGFAASDPECGLVFNATVKGCCVCPTLNIQFDGGAVVDNSTARTLSFDLKLRQDTTLVDAAGMPTNGRPITGSGKVKLNITVTYEGLNAQGVRDGSIYELKSTQEFSFIANATQPGTLQILGNYGAGGDKTYMLNGKKYEFISLRVNIETLSDQLFDNGCTRAMAQQTLVYTTNAESLTFIDSSRELTNKIECGTPIVTFYEADDLANLFKAEKIFNRKYLKRTGTETYSITLLHPDGIEPCKLYGGEISCSCKTRTVYSCYGPGGPATPLTFKTPAAMKFEFSNQGKTVTFTENVVVECNTYTQANPRPYYELWINGVLVETKQLPANGILYAAGDDFTVVDSIWELRLRQKCDTCKNDLVYDKNDLVGVAKLELQPPMCYDNDPDLIAKLTLDGVASPSTYELRLDATPISSGAMTHTTKSVTIPNTAGLYELFVTDPDGNVLRREINYTPTNTSMVDNVLITGTCQNGVIKVRIENLLHKSITLVDWPGTGGDFNVSAGNVVFKDLPSGNYPTIKVQATDYPSCEVIKSLNLDCCNPLPSDITAYSVTYTCAAGVVLSGTAGIVVKLGATVLAAGDSLTAGNHNITVENGACTQARVLTVQPCYQCLSGNCQSMGATVNNKGHESLALCQPACDPCMNNSLSTPVIVMGTYCTTKLIKVQVTGGNTPYVFKVDGIVQAANLVAGYYEMTVNLADGEHEMAVLDNAGCTKTAAFTVACCSGLNVGTQDIITAYKCHPSAPYVEIKLSGTMVGGSRLKITGAGGFEDLWSNPASETETMTLSPGVYTAHVQHTNGCILTKQFTVVGCYNCNPITHQCSQIVSGQNVGYATNVECLNNCNSGLYTASYDCAAGLTVNTSHFIKQGNNQWGPFASDYHAYLTDHDYQIYANNNGQVGEFIGTVTIGCCTPASLTVGHGNCNTSGGCLNGYKAKVSMQLSGGNPANTYKFDILNLNNDVLDTGAIAAGGPAVVNTNCIDENLQVKVRITNVTYMERAYVNTAAPALCGVEKNFVTQNCNAGNQCDLASKIIAAVYLAQNCSGADAGRWKLQVTNNFAGLVNISLYKAEVSAGTVCGTHNGYPGAPTKVFTNVNTGSTVCEAFTNPGGGNEHCVKIVITSVADPTCTLTIYRGTEQ